MSEQPTPPSDPPAPGAYYPPAPAPVLPGHEYASLSLGLGILGLVAGCFCIGLVASPFAVAYGIAARKAIRRAPDRWGGAGMATAGIVLGTIGVVVLVVLVLAALAFAVMLMTGSVETSTPGGIST